jgi:hypothetical protein
MLCVGDDWAEDHHDVELVDEAGRRLARARLPEGLEGMTRLHALIAAHLPEGEPDSDAGLRPGGWTGADRHRDRPRPVGAGAGHGRLSGVRD